MSPRSGAGSSNEHFNLDGGSNNSNDDGNNNGERWPVSAGLTRGFSKAGRWGFGFPGGRGALAHGAGQGLGLTSEKAPGRHSQGPCGAVGTVYSSLGFTTGHGWGVQGVDGHRGLGSSWV